MESKILIYMYKSAQKEGKIYKFSRIDCIAFKLTVQMLYFHIFYASMQIQWEAFSSLTPCLLPYFYPLFLRKMLNAF